MSCTGDGIAEFIAGIAAIGKDMAQPGEALPHGLEDIDRAIAVLISAVCTRMKTRKPQVSVRMWRLRPLIYLPAS